ncbi:MULTISPECIES: hypothetical protein [Streptomyces]|uniref:Uncharacterized protein n=1 Tax=Streptomyces rochei TaxID=1928 RepID=A0ABW7E5E8_STRRO|nr:hypothetical protein [Streptomyces sp. WAC06128]RSS67661.1 hypothetical protein EF911_34555 [Streptomyces sp. WAC06128]
MKTEPKPVPGTPKKQPFHSSGTSASRRTIAVRAAAAVAVAGAVAGLVIWLSQPSYDEIADNCVAALKDRVEGDKGKPAACDGLKEDDYNALVLSHVLGDLGWTDDDGRFDENKMLEDTLSTP